MFIRSTLEDQARSPLIVGWIDRCFSHTVKDIKKKNFLWSLLEGKGWSTFCSWLDRSHRTFLVNSKSKPRTSKVGLLNPWTVKSAGFVNARQKRLTTSFFIVFLLLRLGRLFVRSLVFRYSFLGGLTICFLRILGRLA